MIRVRIDLVQSMGHHAYHFVVDFVKVNITHSIDYVLTLECYEAKA